MNRLVVASIAVAIAIIIAIVVWLAGSARRGGPRPAIFPNSIQSAVSGSVDFVKSRVTGGVGAVLLMDNAAGLPKINSVLPGSPAENAGLRADDYITAVGDWPTAGQSLVDVVEAIRGFAGGKVTVTVQRAGSTNLTFTIHRSSWNALRVPNSVAVPATGLITNPAPLYQIAPSGTN